MPFKYRQKGDTLHKNIFFIHLRTISISLYLNINIAYKSAKFSIVYNIKKAWGLIFSIQETGIAKRHSEIRKNSNPTPYMYISHPYNT